MRKQGRVAAGAGRGAGGEGGAKGGGLRRVGWRISVRDLL